MPYKHEYAKQHIPPKLDRRRKLSEAQKEKIRAEYKQGNISQRELARKYEVSRRLIVFCIYPERLQQNKELYKERRKDGRYYNKDKHKEAIKNTRKYKQSIKDELI